MEKTLTFLLVFTSLCSVLGNSTYYSSFFGQPLDSTAVAQYTANGTLANCTIVVETCSETEGRRIDGTCNNLKHPSYGGTRTPYLRLLAASYHKRSASEFEPRRSLSGKELNLTRVVRTTIWSEGRVDDEHLTSLINHLFVFFATDITNTRDTTNYVTWRPYCCKEAGRNDYSCTPNKVPKTDYVHRFSGIRCLNMTRPLTFQTSGCLANTTTPLRIVDATPLVDLSPVYGNKEEKARRTNTGGKLVTVTNNNRIYFPDTSSLNLLLGINFVGIILFWNNHNFIATKLAEINPCWTDDQLFAQAREINIAYAVQMFYYELVATLMGKDNLIQDGILASDSGFRDPYNDTVLPQIYLEYPVVLRWMHSLQDGDLRMYYKNGTHKSTFPIVDLTSNTDFLKVNDTMDYVTQGFFRQPTANSKDYIADPDIVQRGLGGLQRSNDIMTNDLAKNRYFGFQSYINYRKHCFGDTITSFDDLSDIIAVERITQLKDLYSFVDDIDFLAGTWAEEKKANSFVPPTFYCVVAKQLKLSMVSDRHWYERPDRPNAFNSGFFRQPTANSKDYIADPDIVQRGLGGLQRSNDIMTNDLAKNRYFGFQSYINYRKHCFGDTITSFDDLSDIIAVERITQLKDLYSFVDDIDFLAGTWAEEKKANSFVPPTFYCVVAKQLKLSMVSDRHWYERPDRPNAFNSAQLQEIRKATAARMLCDIGDGVTEVQPRAFELPATGNEIASCDKIPAIDYSKWKDSTCSA